MLNKFPPIFLNCVQELCLHLDFHVFVNLTVHNTVCVYLFVCTKRIVIGFIMPEDFFHGGGFALDRTAYEIICKFMGHVRGAHNIS